MSRILLLLALFGVPIAANAQVNYPLSPPFAGQGIMSVTTASQAVASANVTKAPNSIGFPSSVLPLGVLRVKIQAGAAASVSVCWQGGTCTAANGELMAADESRIVTLSTFSANPPTMIAASGTVSVEVEW